MSETLSALAAPDGALGKTSPYLFNFTISSTIVVTRILHAGIPDDYNPSKKEHRSASIALYRKIDAALTLSSTLRPQPKNRKARRAEQARIRRRRETRLRKGLAHAAPQAPGAAENAAPNLEEAEEAEEAEEEVEDAEEAEDTEEANDAADDELFMLELEAVLDTKDFSNGLQCTVALPDGRRACCKLFGNGRANITGCATGDDVRIVREQMLSFLRMPDVCGPGVDLLPFEIRALHATSTIAAKILPQFQKPKIVLAKRSVAKRRRTAPSTASAPPPELEISLERIAAALHDPLGSGGVTAVYMGPPRRHALMLTVPLRGAGVVTAQLYSTSKLNIVLKSPSVESATAARDALERAIQTVAEAPFDIDRMLEGLAAPEAANADANAAPALDIAHFFPAASAGLAIGERVAGDGSH